MEHSVSCGEALVDLLCAYGFDTVFGIPGTHAVELYRGLENNRLRHILTRHEQGAAFMADGYARASGKPGLCFLITGPGLVNAATAMAQAYSDSVPILVVTPVNETWSLGKCYGRLHEMNNQLDITRPITGVCGTAMTVDELPNLIADAMNQFSSERPRPAHVQIPLDVFVKPVETRWIPRQLDSRRQPDQRSIDRAVKLLGEARFPLIIAGGGARHCGQELRQLAEVLNAPVVTSIRAKGVLPGSHSLCVGSSLSLPETQAFVAEADVVLTLGCDLGQTDLWNDDFHITGTHIRVDIDVQELSDDHAGDLAIQADAAQSVKLMLAGMNKATDSDLFAERSRRVKELQHDLLVSLTPKQKAHMRCLEQVRAVLPEDGLFVGDMTQIVYTANRFLRFEQPGCYLQPTGFGSLGYALPAALGAKVAQPDRVVVAMAGDYGVMFSVQEMLTATENDIHIVLLVWNNSGLSQIRDDMESLGVKPTGVSVTGPDFIKMAESFGWAAHRVQDPETLRDTLAKVIGAPKSTLIEIDEASFLVD